MKKSRYILSTLPVLALMALASSCQNDLLEDYGRNGKGGVTFHISTPVDEQPWMTRSEEGDMQGDRLVSLRYLLADADGKVLDHHYGCFSENLDSLSLDGLTPGDYTIVFLGSSDESAIAEIKNPTRIDAPWLTNTMESMPVDGSYFYKKLDFTVDMVSASLDRSVVLERPVAKVRLDIPGISTVIKSFISSVTVTSDDASFHTVMNADGSYDGKSDVKAYELVDPGFNLEFYTFPSDAPVSGTIDVRAATFAGDSLFTSYRFEDLKVEAGKITEISLKLRHPDLETGYVLIRPRDYYDYEADIMMMEDEDMSVLHDSRHRRHNVIYPLKVSSWENNMRVRLFLPEAVDDVDIYADFPSLGLDSVKVARMERVAAYLDMLVPMPFLERDCHYYDVRGKRVTVPKMNAIPSDIKWYYKTPDPYLAQLAALKFDRWEAWNPAYEVSSPQSAIAPTPDMIRHAFLINQALAIMYDSEEFYSVLEANEGNYEDCGRNVPTEEIIYRVYNVAGFGWGVCNPLAKVWGLGGGSTMMFHPIFFQEEFYPNNQPSLLVSNARGTLFHEFAHCLDYSHDGNMTYGERWTVDCSAAYMNCYRHGKIKYWKPDFVNDAPYKREDAPKWAKPRFQKKP